MEDNWGRRSAAVTLEENTLRQMLAPVSRKAKIAGFELLTAGKANTSYKVYLDGQIEPVLLRLHVRDSLGGVKEFNIFKTLRQRIPLAEILYFEPSPDLYGFSYSLVKWVEGDHLDRVFSSRDSDGVGRLAYEVGKTLAAIGETRFASPGLLDANLEISLPFATTAESWGGFIRRCLEGHTARHLGQTYTERLTRLVEKNTAYLAKLPDDGKLVHADFKGPNILVYQAEDGWRVAAVLDWEFAYAGSPMSDVGTILRHQARFNPAFKQPFIDGFAANGGNLPLDWEKAARLLDLLNLCDFLNQPEPDATLQHEVSGLIRTTIETYAS